VASEARGTGEEEEYELALDDRRSNYDLDGSQDDNRDVETDSFGEPFPGWAAYIMQTPRSDAESSFGYLG
jgi:hypothetical protein